ncbi:unnamed protein product [Parajaminaea phylloscopi]
MAESQQTLHNVQQMRSGNVDIATANERRFQGLLIGLFLKKGQQSMKETGVLPWDDVYVISRYRNEMARREALLKITTSTSSAGVGPFASAGSEHFALRNCRLRTPSSAGACTGCRGI